MNIEHPAITALRIAYDTDLKVSTIFKYNLNKPNSALEAYCKYADQFYNGVFIDDKFTNKFKDSLQINNEYFSFYAKSKKAYILLTQAIIRYAKNHNEPYPIDHFMVHPIYATSLFLMIAKTIHEDYIHAEIKESMDESTKKAVKEMEKSGIPLTTLPKIYTWYKAHRSHLSALNRGSWEISPLTSFDGFLRQYIAFILSNNCGIIHIGSVSWYKFLEFLSEEYCISVEGTVDTAITYDVNYTHETVKSPRGFLGIGGS